MAKKKSGRPRSQPSPRPSRAMAPPILEVLDLVDEFIARKQWDEARTLLADLDRHVPNNKAVIGAIVNFAYERQDMVTYQSAARRLLRLTPDDADLTLALGGAYVNLIQPALALRTLGHFLERWPDHPRAAEARKMVADMQPAIAIMLRHFALEGPDALDLAAQHEEIHLLFSGAQWAQARALAERTLRRKPDFIPVLNNLSQTYFVEGRIDEAIATAQRALALKADNYHALANLARYHYLSGRADEARQWAAQLTAIASEAPDIWTKTAEALAYLGDDQGVLDALHGAERANTPELGASLPTLYHFAAVAALRLGREDEARGYWRRALKGAPWLVVAEQNLNDLRLPVGERHAPWIAVLIQWVPQRLLDAYDRLLEPAARRGDAAVDAAHRRFLQRFPEFIPLIPLLLDRGDPDGRQLALDIALPSDLPVVHEALRAFALGQRGPDTMRIQAARAAQAAGLIPVGPVRLWTRGRWHDLPLLGWEIHHEPVAKHTPQVEEWVHEATDALRIQDAARGERLLKRALEHDPDAPDIWNNLAAAYSMQGREEEAEEITRRVHAQNPNYLHGRTNLALFLTQKGQLNEAEALLKPLIGRERLHFSEFGAVLHAQIELLMARKDQESARAWFDVWAATDPDHPVVAIWRERFEKTSRPSWLFRGGRK